MGKIYSIPFSGVAVAAAQDLWEVTAVASKPFILHEIVIGQISDYGDAQSEGLRVDIKRASGAFTPGSAGQAAIPVKHASNDSAAASTAKINNTGQAVAGAGSLSTIRAETFNVQGGYQYLPPPEQRMIFYGGEILVVSITAPTDSLTMNGTLVFEEL